MLTNNLKANIDKSVEILRRYRKTAIERNNKDAKKDIEIVMHTLDGLCKIIWRERDE